MKQIKDHRGPCGPMETIRQSFHNSVLRPHHLVSLCIHSSETGVWILGMSTALRDLSRQRRNVYQRSRDIPR